MIVGALAWIEVTAGITEASMTRKPSNPCTSVKLVDVRDGILWPFKATCQAIAGRCAIW